MLAIYCRLNLTRSRCCCKSVCNTVLKERNEVKTVQQVLLHWTQTWPPTVCGVARENSQGPRIPWGPQSRIQSPQAFWSAGRRQERLWRFRNNLNFFDWLLCISYVTASIVLPQKSYGNKIPVPQSLSWQPTAVQRAWGLSVRDCGVPSQKHYNRCDIHSCFRSSSVFLTSMTSIQLHSQRYAWWPGLWFDFDKTGDDWWIKGIPNGTIAVKVAIEFLRIKHCSTNPYYT